MTADKWVNFLVPITLIEMMFAIGLAVTFSDVIAVARNWKAMGRALAANFVLVPAATIALLLLFGANRMVSLGFLVLAVCPGAPFGPPLTTLARGNVNFAVGLMIILGVSCTLLAPLLLNLSIDLIGRNNFPLIRGGVLLSMLLVTQLLPLFAGLGFLHALPSVARRIERPAKRLSRLLNLATIVLILGAQWKMFVSIQFRAVIGMLTLLALSLLIGWGTAWIGGDEPRSMTLTTSLRNIGLGLVIANRIFPDSPALNAVIAYGLIGVLGSLTVAIFWSRQTVLRLPAVAMPCEVSGNAAAFKGISGEA